MTRFINPVVFKLKKIEEENNKLKGETIEEDNNQIISIDEILDEDEKIEFIVFPKFATITGLPRNIDISEGNLNNIEYNKFYIDNSFTRGM